MKITALIGLGHLRSALVSRTCGQENANSQGIEWHKVEKRLSTLQKQKKELFEPPIKEDPERWRDRMISTMLCSSLIKLISFVPSNPEHPQHLYVQKGESLPPLIEAPFLKPKDVPFDRRYFSDAGSVAEGVEGLNDLELIEVIKTILACFFYDKQIAQLALIFKEGEQLIARSWEKRMSDDRHLFLFVTGLEKSYESVVRGFPGGEGDQRLEALNKDPESETYWKNRTLYEAEKCKGVSAITFIPAEQKIAQLIHVRIIRGKEFDCPLYSHQYGKKTFLLPVRTPKEVYDLSKKTIDETIVEFSKIPQIRTIIECFMKDRHSKGLGLTVNSGFYLWLT